MPGPAPKRPQNRSRVPRGKALAVASPRSGSSIRPRRPDPPKGTLPRVRALWNTFWASPLAEHVIDSDRAALLRLFGYYDQRERFLEEGSKRVLMHGSTGQPAINPLIKQVDVLDAKILALEDRFGLSPMARLKLQVTLGDATKSLADINAALASTHDDEHEDDQDEGTDPRVIAFRSK